MLDFLLKQSVLNVWCSPFQDGQAILALNRVSPVERFRDYFTYQGIRTFLPTKGEQYHVYSIGQNSHVRLHLVEEDDKWFPIASLGELHDNHTELYLSSGLQLSKAYSYVMRTSRQAYIVAVRHQPIIANVDYEQVYMRLYTNAYYESSRDVTGEEKVISYGIEVKKIQDVADWQNRFLVYRQKGYGLAIAFHNGYMKSIVNSADVKIGDILEFTFDASVKEVVEFKIDTLPMFTSELDAKQKYLLHPPKKMTTIDYRDDVDFYIVKRAATGAVRGKLYNRNREMSIRMVTHRDWSILTEQVQQIFQAEPGWTNTTDLYIRAHIRHSGYDRPLVDEHNRIKELYKLSDANIVRAMIGLDATVDNWKVNTLEQSSYTRIMRSFMRDLTGFEAAKAYGYNSIAKQTADSPIQIRNGFFDLLPGVQVNSTIYEFDANGLLLGWRTHAGGAKYYPQFSNTVMVEAIAGIGSRNSAFQYSDDECVLLPGQTYRFYVSPITSNGLPTNAWKDVTNDPAYYSVNSAGTVSWSIDKLGQLGVVKGDLNYISYDYSIDEFNHLYRFTLNHTSQDPRVLEIPVGRIDIWMNGKALIENIDYSVVANQIVVWNKEYLKTLTQKFTIRATGFASVGEEGELYRELASQRGFVQHQMLSVNNVYDLRDDKVVRVIANGRTFHRSQIEFAENQRQISLPNLANGRPYLVQDSWVPVRDVVPYNTYPFIEASKQTDKAVSDYLTTKLPEIKPAGLSAIPDRYMIYSPTMGRLIFDLGTERILPLHLTVEESEVARLMEPYLWLLEYDPCRRDDVDMRYVAIHPHPQKVVLDVTKAVYLFLEWINRLYLNNRVDLSYFLRIVGDGTSIPTIPDIPEIPDPDPIIPAPPIIKVRSDAGVLKTPAVKTISMITQYVAVDYEYEYYTSEGWPSIFQDKTVTTPMYMRSISMTLPPTIRVPISQAEPSVTSVDIVIEENVVDIGLSQSYYNTTPTVGIELVSPNVRTFIGSETEVRGSISMSVLVEDVTVRLSEATQYVQGTPAIKSISLK